MNLTQSRTKESPVTMLAIVLGLSLLFGLVAQIAIPLPFTQVPISFTSHFILMSAVFFGRKGAYATLAYLIEGAMGFPVFSNGGGGIPYMLGPTGGYLVGFLMASFAIAYLVEQFKDKNPSKIFALMLSGNVLIYVFGIPYLAFLIGWQKALLYGLYPFIAGDLLKLMLAHKGLKALKYFGK